MFCIGNILGPILGNYGYVEIGLEETSEYVGYIAIMFGIAYFFLCDDIFYQKPPINDISESIHFLDSSNGEGSKLENRTLPEIDISSISLRRIKL